MIIMLYTKEVVNVANFETSYVKTGFNGLWGNKGAVAIAARINGRSVCFINSHLTPHDGNVQQRISEYHNINYAMKFRKVAGDVQNHE